MSEAAAGWRAELAAILPTIEGWATTEKAIRLAELVLATGAETSVEIGVHGGRGALAMAIGHRELGRGRVFAVDPWLASASLEGTNDPANDAWWGALDHEQVFHSFLHAVMRLGLAEHCEVVRSRSQDAVRLFRPGSIGVLHQDGNHSEEISCREVEDWAPLLASGGYWVMDDVAWATTQRAQRMLAERGFAALDDHESWRVYQKP